jgi:hypothetical protein
MTENPKKFEKCRKSFIENKMNLPLKAKKIPEEFTIKNFSYYDLS